MKKHERELRSVMTEGSRKREEIERLLAAPLKEIEKALGVKFRNGQGTAAAKAALRWVLG